MNRSSQLSVTQSLIIVNVVVFVLGLMVTQPAKWGIPMPGGAPTSFAEIHGAYSWFTCFTEGELWRLITYQFVHADVGHILFNMWALFFFGPAVERVMGGTRFLLFYFACGIAGALFSSLLAWEGLYTTLANSPADLYDIYCITHMLGCEGLVQPWQMVMLVGASASIYGVMIATAFLYPHAQISLLFPPVTLRMWMFALAIIGIAAIVILFDLSNAGGEAGHLGGVIMGAAIMLAWKLKTLMQRR